MINNNLAAIDEVISAMYKYRDIIADTYKNTVERNQDNAKGIDELYHHRVLVMDNLSEVQGYRLSPKMTTLLSSFPKVYDDSIILGAKFDALHEVMMLDIDEYAKSVYDGRSEIIIHKNRESVQNDFINLSTELNDHISRINLYLSTKFARHLSLERKRKENDFYIRSLEDAQGIISLFMDKQSYIEGVIENDPALMYMYRSFCKKIYVYHSELSVCIQQIIDLMNKFIEEDRKSSVISELSHFFHSNPKWTFDEEMFYKLGADFHPADPISVSFNVNIHDEYGMDKALRAAADVVNHSGDDLDDEPIAKEEVPINLIDMEYRGNVTVKPAVNANVKYALLDELISEVVDTGKEVRVVDWFYKHKARMLELEIDPQTFMSFVANATHLTLNKRIVRILIKTNAVDMMDGVIHFNDVSIQKNKSSIVF